MQIIDYTDKRQIIYYKVCFETNVQTNLECLTDLSRMCLRIMRLFEIILTNIIIS
jgi:hypothetical protein